MYTNFELTYANMSRLLMEIFDLVLNVRHRNVSRMKSLECSIWVIIYPHKLNSAVFANAKIIFCVIREGWRGLILHDCFYMLIYLLYLRIERISRNGSYPGVVKKICSFYEHSLGIHLAWHRIVGSKEELIVMMYIRLRPRSLWGRF